MTLEPRAAKLMVGEQVSYEMEDRLNVDEIDKEGSHKSARIN